MSDLLELELEVIVSYPAWMLGTKTAISMVPNILLLLLCIILIVPKGPVSTNETL